MTCQDQILSSGVMNIHNGTQASIPVTVIGGYLGAGKTTCLNHLLGGDHGLRLAVLVNDFGAINVDAHLIAQQAADTIALMNGCVCCSIADDLGAALTAQVERIDPPEHVLIEASGVAEPAKIGRLAGNWPGCVMAGIVVLADAVAIRARSADKFVGRLVVRQLRDADLVAVNKVDLVNGAEQQATVDWIKTVAPHVCLMETRHGALPIEILGGDLATGKRHEGGPSAQHPLLSMVWIPESPVIPEVLHRVLSNLADIHRAKGIIPTAHGLRLIQWSSGKFACTVSPGSATGLVVIGPFSASRKAVLQRALAASSAVALSASTMAD